MMKYKAAAFLLAFATVFSLAGCKGDSTSSVASKDPASQVSSEDGTVSSEDAAVSSEDAAVSSEDAAVSSEDGTESDSASSDTGSTTSSSNSSTSSKGSSNSGTPAIKNDVVIKEGTKALESNLNFGGKTYTMVTWSAPDAATKRVINAFQSKFNCKINVQVYSFNTFNQQVVAHLASKKKADISQMHGSMFPTGVISNLYQPLDSHITTADLYKASAPKAGGFDLDKSKGFAWNNKLYGVAGYYSINPYLMFYNKKMFKEAGLDDPRELYNKGKWTWDKLLEIGREVTIPEDNVYLADASFREKAVVLSNDASYVKYVNNVPAENLTDPKVYNGLKLLQQLCKEVVNTKGGGGTDPSLFYNGNVYMYAQESFAYYNFAKEIPNKNAFGKTMENLGIVPFPLGPDNKSGAYPTGWLSSYCSGIGSDPKVALAWAKFSTYYKDPVKPEVEFKKEDQTLIEKLIKKISYPNYGFADSSITADTISHNIEGAVMRGEDISKTLNTWKQPLQNCIKATLDQQK